MSYESLSLWCTLCPSLTLMSYGLPSDVFCLFFWCPLCFFLLSYLPLFMFLMYYVSLWYILWSFLWLLYFSFMSSEPSCGLSVFLFNVLCVGLWWPLSHFDVPSFIFFLCLCLFISSVSISDVLCVSFLYSLLSLLYLLCIFLMVWNHMLCHLFISLISFVFPDHLIGFN